MWCRVGGSQANGDKSCLPGFAQDLPKNCQQSGRPKLIPNQSGRPKAEIEPKAKLTNIFVFIDCKSAVPRRAPMWRRVGGSRANGGKSCLPRFAQDSPRTANRVDTQS